MIDLFGRFLRYLALFAGFLLLVLMLFTVVDVVLRNVFNMPLRSVYEFTEFLMAPIVFLAVAYTGWVGAHIAVDLFAKWLDRPGLQFIPAILAFMGAALFALIAYRATLETIATIDQVSNLLRWPYYPFRFSVAFGAGLFAIVLLIQAVQALRGAPTEGNR
ncbi:MAG TPA: TRAP transporter small permease [Xanthobacteraceae bacterium]|nr:TRAP transporter small permease [Xanthobacteraceae bacterium]